MPRMHRVEFNCNVTRRGGAIGKKVVALHEAAHAILIRKFGGYTTNIEVHENWELTQGWTPDNINPVKAAIICVGGHVAEWKDNMLFRPPQKPSSEDYEDAAAFLKGTGVSLARVEVLANGYLGWFSDLRPTARKLLEQAQAHA